MEIRMSEPRAYTEDEVRDMILAHVRRITSYWGNLPDVDPATGDVLTIKDRCEGVAHSILVLLDGGTGMPAITLKLAPHPDDKGFRRSEGENWFEPGMELGGALHERFYTEP
jgi:hypothetical protein